MKKISGYLAAVLAILAVLTALVPHQVRADSVTSVVMTYQDKKYTKQIYGVETDRIKAGENTDSLRDIEGLLNNLTFQTNGEVKVDRSAVVNAVKAAINAGQTGINIDLTKYMEVKLPQPLQYLRQPPQHLPQPQQHLR